MAASRIPAAVAAIVAAARAALPSVAVGDGPQVSTTSSDRLYVGVSDLEDEEQVAVDGGAQEWAGLGGKAKDERFTVQCAAVAEAGDTDLAALRTRVFGNVAALEAALRADLSAAGSVMYVGLSVERVTQAQTTNGGRVRVYFTVACRARI